MTSKINRLPNQLSQGENQKILIIRAIINNPFLLVADEPFANIDKEIQDAYALDLETFLPNNLKD